MHSVLWLSSASSIASTNSYINGRQQDLEDEAAGRPTDLSSRQKAQGLSPCLHQNVPPTLTGSRSRTKTQAFQRNLQTNLERSDKQETRTKPRRTQAHLVRSDELISVATFSLVGIEDNLSNVVVVWWHSKVGAYPIRQRPVGLIVPPKPP